MAVPEIVFGGATMSKIYNTGNWLASDIPFRTLRLALRYVYPFLPLETISKYSLRYGIRCIDTSSYYGPSEVVIGAILQKLAAEFPRATYRIMTKCGREGQSFDYKPQSIRASVMRSLRRLSTTYLDVVLLHDIEHVASPVWPIPYCGDFERALTDKTVRNEWGLDPEKLPRAWGTGDDTILAAVRELQKMKEEGLIKAVGISGE
jgi:D-arabinose 1-dehydrogenase